MRISSDRALQRPGHFDRQIVMDAPNDGLRAILKLHQRGKQIATNVDLRKIAQVTPGLSGADLENVMNEAALIARAPQSENHRAARHAYTARKI